MVHILLLILKIIGIIVLSILGLALLILFFPITYVGKVNGNIEEKKITGNIRAGWLFHLLHCRLWIENTEIHYNIRLLGIKIKSSEAKEKKKKEKKKKEKRKNQSEEQSPKNEEEKSQDELKEDSVKETDIKQIGTSKNEKEQEIQNSNLEETDVKNQNNENIKSEVTLKEINYPIKKGDSLGVIKYYNSDGIELGRLDIISENNLEEITFKNKMKIFLREHGF